MHTTIHAAPGSGHLSRRERQRLRRAEAFSRRQLATSPAAPPVKLDREDLELIDHRCAMIGPRCPRRCWWSPGIGAGEASRRAPATLEPSEPATVH